jgi:hypothetical protein
VVTKYIYYRLRVVPLSNCCSTITQSREILPQFKSLASNYINFKYFILKCVTILLIHNIYHTLENSHSLSTYELALEADCTESCEIHTYNPV